MLIDELMIACLALKYVALLAELQLNAMRSYRLDLGVCNLATLYIESEKPAIYSGRAVLSDWIYHTKRIAERQSKLPKRKHISKWIRKALRCRQGRLRHAINTMLRSIFERLGWRA